MPPELPLDAFCDKLAVLVSIRKDLEELAARAGEPSRDVQAGARMASDYLQALEKLDDRVPLRDFLEQLELIDDLRRSAKDIAAGRYHTTEEVMKRLAVERKRRAKARAGAAKRARRNGGRK